MEPKKKGEKIIIRRVVVGPLQVNCYLVADGETKEGVIIDPGAEPEKIFRAVKENGLTPKFILLTHNHFDHIGSLEEMKNLLNTRCLIGEGGDELNLGNLKIEVLATPGHTPDSVCYIIEENPPAGEAGNIFSGDTLFRRGVGRTDLKGGDFKQMQKSLKRLMDFPDDFKVWPGHGEPTTIGEEKNKY